MGFLTILYMALFYIATIILIAGLANRIRMYATTPAPLKIPTTPAPVTKAGVGFRLFREVVFFESLFKATKWTWIFGWVFHMALALVTIRHLRYFIPGDTFIIGDLITLATPFGVYAGYAMLFGLAGLFARRIFVDRVRYISAPSDYLMLIMIFAIAASGLLMKFVFHTDVIAVQDFMMGVYFFQWGSIPDLPGDILLLVHLTLVILLMVIFPFSKLLHAGGVFFSPTRNQVDNPREQRHISDWARKLEE